MPFPAGSKLGSYETLAQIGVGGMGEVYRARDTRLLRDVALKILPEDVFVEGIGSRSTRRTDRVEVETGSRTLWREDAYPKGLHGMWVPLITLDGKTRVYTYGHGVSGLWIADGFK